MKLQYRLGWTLARLMSVLVFRVRVSGREHLPREGGFILALNHISYFDPPLAGSWVPRELYFFAKMELFKNRLFGAVLRSVNALPVKRAAIDRQAINLAIQAINRGYGLTFFPEGTRSKTGDFLEPKSGVGMIARQSSCPIVPGHISGFDNARAAFFGKKRARIVFGEPFPAAWVNAFPAEKDGYMAISKAIMARIGELRDKALSLK
jgi:1-acyl-sn-glycerol-3-phosphate acyltransferase